MYHLICRALSLPEPGTDALSTGAGRHLGRNRENRLQITDTVGVDGEDSKVLLFHIVGIALVCDSKTTSHDLVRINRVSSVVRTNCKFLSVPGCY